jgi:hypothetical protein
MQILQSLKNYKMRSTAVIFCGPGSVSHLLTFGPLTCEGTEAGPSTLKDLPVRTVI